jgi:moderate conductance mechanosensitive channel
VTDVLISILSILLIILAGLLARLILVQIVKWIVRQARIPPSERSHWRRHAGRLATAWAGEREAQRSAALGSLVISVASVVIGLVCILGILTVLGIDLTPVLASAGVLAVVIGFGAQNLVKDLISGVGMLLEDQIGIGDIVDMDKASGTVEAVGLRVTRLRDSTGVIWYVRNGEVLRVGNKSKGWSEILIDLEIDAEADLAEAQDLVSQVVHRVAADPTFGPDLLDPPKLAGIEDVTGSGVTLRIHGKAKPDRDVAIERELRYQLKLAFDAAGIRLAPAQTP